ncbi:MAG: flagellar export chaperone FlgN [Armatimonadetes bacterium]|nr:flagellar export chaperone FlgN [Armatimonadota bacterium]
MTNLQQPCANLRRNLQQHLLLARRLLRFTKEQSEVLVSGDIRRLSEIEEQQRDTIAQQQALEPQREEATRALIAVLGLSKESRLTEFLPNLPLEEQKAFTQIRKELLKVQEELSEVKQRNIRLLENALEFAQVSLESLTQTVFKTSRYGTNLMALSAPAFLLDSRA